MLQRFRQRYYTEDDITKAAHILQCHALKQKVSESGAEFVDRDMLEYLALRHMGINVDDSTRFTKFIRSLAQTIFTTPNMSLGHATSLFETYNPPSTSTSTSDTPTVNALFRWYSKGKTTQRLAWSLSLTLRSCVNSLPSLCLHVLCPQSYSQALNFPEVSGKMPKQQNPTCSETSFGAGRSCPILRVFIIKYLPQLSIYLHHHG